MGQLPEMGEMRGNCGEVTGSMKVREEKKINGKNAALTFAAVFIHTWKTYKHVLHRLPPLHSRIIKCYFVLACCKRYHVLLTTSHHNKISGMCVCLQYRRVKKVKRKKSGRHHAKYNKHQTLPHAHRCRQE